MICVNFPVLLAVYTIADLIHSISKPLNPVPILKVDGTIPFLIV